MKFHQSIFAVVATMMSTTPATMNNMVFVGATSYRSSSSSTTTRRQPKMSSSSGNIENNNVPSPSSRRSLKAKSTRSPTSSPSSRPSSSMMPSSTVMPSLAPSDSPSSDLYGQLDKLLMLVQQHGLTNVFDEWLYENDIHNTNVTCATNTNDSISSSTQEVEMIDYLISLISKKVDEKDDSPSSCPQTIDENFDICGQPLTGEIKLTKSYNCSGGDGPTLLNGATLDCNGHTIFGDGTNDGISVTDFGNNNKIQNCIIQNFNNGIVFNTKGLSIENVKITETTRCVFYTAVFESMIVKNVVLTNNGICYFDSRTEYIENLVSCDNGYYGFSPTETNGTIICPDDNIYPGFCTSTCSGECMT